MSSARYEAALERLWRRAVAASRLSESYLAWKPSPLGGEERTEFGWRAENRERVLWLKRDRAVRRILAANRGVQ